MNSINLYVNLKKKLEAVKKKRVAALFFGLNNKLCELPNRNTYFFVTMNPFGSNGDMFI